MSIDEVVAAEIRVAALNSLPSMAWGLGGGSPDDACDRVEALVRQARLRALPIERFEMDAAYAVRDWPRAETGETLLVDGVPVHAEPGLKHCLIVRFADASRASA